ncbi:MAG: hypothetical protein Alis3KO_04470 [Aliiglaciecola sp.]
MQAAIILGSRFSRTIRCQLIVPMPTLTRIEGKSKKNVICLLNVGSEYMLGFCSLDVRQYGNFSGIEQICLLVIYNTNIKVLG